MFLQLVAIEQKKLTKRKILWIESAIVALAAILVPLIFYWASNNAENANVSVSSELPVAELLAWPEGLSLGLGMMSGGLGSLLIVILMGTLTAQEYSWRTMQLWLSHGVRRPVLLLAKFTAVLLPVLVLVLVAFVAGGITTGIMTQTLQGSLPLADVAWGQAFLSLLRTAYTLLPYAALTFLLAIVGRSAVLAVGGGLTFVMLIEGVAIQLFNFLGGVWADVAAYLPASLGSSLIAINRVTAVAQTPPSGGVTATVAAAALGLYTLIFLGLALLAFQRQDLGG